MCRRFASGWAGAVFGLSQFDPSRIANCRHLCVIVCGASASWIDFETAPIACRFSETWLIEAFSALRN